MACRISATGLGDPSSTTISRQRVQDCCTTESTASRRYGLARFVDITTSTVGSDMIEFLRSSTASRRPGAAP
jgi:hypothetical protein